MNPFTTWRTTSSTTSSDLLNLSAGSSTSTLNGSSLASQSLESMLSDNTTFDIAALIQNTSFLSNGVFRSVSAPATFRQGITPCVTPGVTVTQGATPGVTPSSVSGVITGSHGVNKRLPLDYAIKAGLTPPPSPNQLSYIKKEPDLPSPKRQNSQPSPTTFSTFRDLNLPPSSLANIPQTGIPTTQQCGIPTTQQGGISTTQHGGIPTGIPQQTIDILQNMAQFTQSEPSSDRTSQSNSSEDAPERTTSGKRKRIEDDYVMIEPVSRKENPVQQEMRELFESIVATRAELNQLKSGPSLGLTKRKEKSRLNSALDRKIKRFKEMRLQFLESVLTLEHTTLRNVLEKAASELQFCKSKGIPESISSDVMGQIDSVLEKCISGDVKGFFARSIGICDEEIGEE